MIWIEADKYLVCYKLCLPSTMEVIIKHDVYLRASSYKISKSAERAG